MDQDLIHTFSVKSSIISFIPSMGYSDSYNITEICHLNHVNLEIASNSFECVVNFPTLVLHDHIIQLFK